MFVLRKDSMNCQSVQCKSKRQFGPNQISCNRQNLLLSKISWPEVRGSKTIHWLKNLLPHCQSWILSISSGIRSTLSFRPLIWRITLQLCLKLHNWLNLIKNYMNLWKMTGPKLFEQPKGMSKNLELGENSKLSLERTQDFQNMKRPNIHTQSKGRTRMLGQCTLGCK